MKNIKFLLLLCLIIGISNFLLAEPIQVRGTITDETGQALKSATISVKGKKTGTISNEKGYYVIAAEIGDFLVYNYIGYEKKVLKVNKQVMNVQMTPSSQTLSEFNVLCELSVNDALQGQIAGLEVKRSFLQNSHRGKNIYQTQIAVADNEEYDKLNENRFISVSSEALSTFSLDVDAASYTNVRRMINQGNMHNKAAVRIEEMINYFSYNYPQPSSEHPVNILPELAVCPWNTKHQLLRIGVKAREIPTENLPNSNFVFLIDVSG
jgi:Ca-activated chloride channel family protein